MGNNKFQRVFCFIFGNGFVENVDFIDVQCNVGFVFVFFYVFVVVGLIVIFYWIFWFDFYMGFVIIYMVCCFDSGCQNWFFGILYVLCCLNVVRINVNFLKGLFGLKLSKVVVRVFLIIGLLFFL